MRPFRVVLACMLAHALVAQEQPKPRLNIVIVEGDGAINNIRQRTAREPIVQVEDENHKPVAGAVVVFTLPERGASGVFANGSHMTTTVTDAQGRAVARGLRPNSTTGKYQIRVSASHEGRKGDAVLTQSNVLTAVTTGAAAGISGKLIALLAVAGAAAVGGVVAATRGGGASTPAGGTQPAAPPVIISPGSPSVGAPK